MKDLLRVSLRRLRIGGIYSQEELEDFFSADVVYWRYMGRAVIKTKSKDNSGTYKATKFGNKYQIDKKTS